MKITSSATQSFFQLIIEKFEINHRSFNFIYRSIQNLPTLIYAMLVSYKRIIDGKRLLGPGSSIYGHCHKDFQALRFSNLSKIDHVSQELDESMYKITTQMKEAYFGKNNKELMTSLFAFLDHMTYFNDSQIGKNFESIPGLIENKLDSIFLEILNGNNEELVSITFATITKIGEKNPNFLKPFVTIDFCDYLINLIKTLDVEIFIEHCNCGKCDKYDIFLLLKKLLESKNKEIQEFLIHKNIMLSLREFMIFSNCKQFLFLCLKIIQLRD